MIVLEEQTEVIDFQRDTGERDAVRISVVMVALDGAKVSPKARVRLPSSTRPGSTWAWANAEIARSRADLARFAPRLACEAVVRQAHAFFGLVRDVVLGLLEERWGAVDPESVQWWFYLEVGEVNRDGFLVVSVEPRDPGDFLPVILPPALVDIPRGILPDDPCRTCDGCVALMAAVATLPAAAQAAPEAEGHGDASADAPAPVEAPGASDEALEARPDEASR